MLESEELLERIRCVKTQGVPLHERYARLYDVLASACGALSADWGECYSGLFSQLAAVCRRLGLERSAIDAFRRRARRIKIGSDAATEEQFEADAETLASFIRAATSLALEDRKAVPANSPIDKRLWVNAENLPHVVAGTGASGLLAVVIDVKEGAVLVDAADGGQLTIKPSDATLSTFSLLRPGLVVNLLGLHASDGGYMARLIVVEPDYLIDVSTLSACVKSYGAHPFNFLLTVLTPHTDSRHALLGDLANHFVDDLTYNSRTPSRDFMRECMKAHFREVPLRYLALSDEVDGTFYEDACRQFDHIAQTLYGVFPSNDSGISLEKLLLEPQLICATLGLRGRLDMMSLDNRTVVELKSGKASGFTSKRPQPQHVVQMTLYAEMLHYNFGIPREQIRSYLLYSKYPMLFDERGAFEVVAHAVSLRNRIVLMMKTLAEGGAEHSLGRLTLDTLNENNLDTHFFQQYLRPEIEKALRPIADTQGLERSYFMAFLEFLCREQFVAKTFDLKANSTRGFARTWRASEEEKLLTGDLIKGMRIQHFGGEQGVEEISFLLTQDDELFVPNFRIGEMVLLYNERAMGIGMMTGVLSRAFIKELTKDKLTLTLHYSQRNAHAFPEDGSYAVVHDYVESSFIPSFRGLYAFLSAPDERRDLLLGRRKPRFNAARQLLGSYGVQTDGVVLSAKQAMDYFLLVGPPGTGKTSVALRAIVEEFLLEGYSDERGALLLTAYTNRAVDEICAMLTRIGTDFLRIGVVQTCPLEYRRYLLSERVKEINSRAELRLLLDAVPIAVGTLATLSSRTELFVLKSFCGAVVDEASQVLEPQLLTLLSAVRPDGSLAVPKFIMIGDHKQLPAVVAQPEPQTHVNCLELRHIGLTDLRNSLFQRLHALCLSWRCNKAIGMLSRQGRMHESIAEFVNSAFYEDKLSTVPLPHQQGALRLETSSKNSWENFVATTRFGFINVEREANAANLKINAAEADVVARLLKTLDKLYESMGERIDFEKQVGIIVPFRNQIGCIRAALCKTQGTEWAESVMIDTVECYQGSQRDFIVFSTVVSEPWQLRILSNVQVIEGAEVDRKLNVALTRARRQLFVVGSARVLKESNVYARLISAAQVFAIS